MHDMPPLPGREDLETVIRPFAMQGKTAGCTHIGGQHFVPSGDICF
jgi:hypothetical protein